MGKPARMQQGTWEYLVTFTDVHEAAVLHMYNNRTSAAGKQDVTCGVGLLLPTRDFAARWYKNLFYYPNPATGVKEPATDEQLAADWDAAAGLMRVYGVLNNLEHGPDGTKGYADVCQLRMHPELVALRRNDLLGSKLESDLKSTHLQEQFWDFPAQAQVAVASFCYGRSLQVCPGLTAALRARDFEWAAREASLKGMSDRKNLHHRILFWNAALIDKYRPGNLYAYDALPLSASEPAQYLDSSNTFDMRSPDAAPPN